MTRIRNRVIRYVLDATARAHEIVLVDLGPSPSETIMPTVLGLADRILWVSTPDLTAVRHLLRASQILAAAGVPPGRAAAVLNAVPRRGQLVPVEEIRRESPFPLWAEIPADPSVPAREGTTPPLGPKPVQEAVERLARRLLQELGLDDGAEKPDGKSRGRRGWWPFRKG